MLVPKDEKTCRAFHDMNQHDKHKETATQEFDVIDQKFSTLTASDNDCKAKKQKVVREQTHANKKYDTGSDGKSMAIKVTKCCFHIQI